MLATRSTRGGGNEPRRGTLDDNGQVRSIHSPAGVADRTLSPEVQPFHPVPGAASIGSHMAF